MNIGLRIKELREQNRLTQSEFAKKISISRSSLINYETNKREVPLKILMRISELFNINMDDLTGSVPTLTYEESEILTKAGMITKTLDVNCSSEDSKLESFKEFLEKQDFPASILNEIELQVLHTKTIEYIEFELSRLGYFKVSK